MHRCPGPECVKRVPDDKLACREHWYQVPRQLRNAVWRAWADGAGAGTEAHQLTMKLAIADMRPL